MVPFYSPLPGRQPFLESNNFEEACDVLGRLIGSHQSILNDDLSQFHCRYYHAPLPQSQLVYIQWSGRQRLTRTQSSELYVLYLPINGTIEERINHHELTQSSPQCAHLFSPEQLLEGRLPSRGQGISVCFPKALVLAECQKLAAKPLPKSLEFQVALNLNTVQGKSLKELVWFLWDQSHQESVLLPQLEGVLVSGLLQHHFHTYATELRSPACLLGKSQLQAAKAFIFANLENPITVGDIAQAIETNARSLQRSFAKHCDCTPKQFLTNARLDAIHSLLQRGIVPQTIADIMNQYQFSSFGRCSQKYRERFGELPSETLRRFHNQPLSESRDVNDRRC